MQTIEYDLEMKMLSEIAGDFPRSPWQKNKLSTADAEIIQWPGGDTQCLVLKADGIHEEIQIGLYKDPYQIGWMAITVCISDLAAVGADPFGILLSLQLPKSYDHQWLEGFKRGVNAACKKYEVHVLGGDTNFCPSVSVSTTGVATITNTRPMLRVGMKPGDLLYTTGKPGLGNAFAYDIFFEPEDAIEYMPVARLFESKSIRRFATACIDTSDGLFPAISVLSAINHVGVYFTSPLQDLLHPEALETKTLSELPSWMMLAGPHGDYELLFTIAPEDRREFEAVCNADHWQPVLLGKITAESGLSFLTEDLQVHCHPAVIANLFSQSNDHIPTYFELLMNQHLSWCPKHKVNDYAS